MGRGKGYRPEKGKFRIDFSFLGHRYTEVVNDEPTAIIKVAQIKKEALDGKEAVIKKASKEITLQEAFENCYNDPVSEWKDTEHGKKMKYYGEAFCKYFGANRKLRDIKIADWWKFIEQFPQTATNNRRACCMNKIMKHANSQGNLTADNVLKIPRKKEKLTRLVTFSAEEEQAMYKVCDQLGYFDLKDIIVCLLDTGCRAEELLSLTPTDVVKHREAWTLNVMRYKTDTQTSVGVSERVKKILMRRMNQPRIFMTNYKKVARKWNDVRLQLGQTDNPDWVMHVCRHTCASRLASSGSLYTEVCDWMGWSQNSPTARRYLHFFPKTKIGMAKKLDAYNAEETLELSVVSGGKIA